MLYPIFLPEFSLRKPFNHQHRQQNNESSKIIHRYAVTKNVLLLLFEKNNIVIF